MDLKNKGSTSGKISAYHDAAAAASSNDENDWQNETEDELNSARDNDEVSTCYLCSTSLTGGYKSIPIDLNKPLPSSSLDPFSLLQCFGVQIFDNFFCDNSPVEVCSKCYVVITECDILYPLFHSVISKLIELWPEKLGGIKTFSLNVSFPTNYSCDDQLVYQKKEPVVVGSRRKKIKCENQIVNEDLFIPDVLVSFSYIEEGTLVPKVFEKLAKRPSSTKIFVSKSFICEFCNMVFQSERDWCCHFTKVHKIKQKWQSYGLQTNLRKCLYKEVQWNSKQTIDCRRKLGIEPAKRRCYACLQDFVDRSMFVDHLQHFHCIGLSSLSILTRETDNEAQGKCEIVEEEPDDDQFSTCPVDSDMDSKAKVRKVISSSKTKHRYARSLVSIENHQDQNRPGKVKIMYTPHWRCRICGEMFTDQNDFENHKQMNHAESTRPRKKRKYEDCHTVGSGPNVCPLTVEPRRKKFICNLCNIVLDNKEALKEHNNLTHERYAVVLESDGQGGVNDRRIKLAEGMPEEEVHNEGPDEKNEHDPEGVEADDDKTEYTCGLCREEFTSRLSMIQHSCSAQDNDANISGCNEIVMIECKICERRLHGANALRLHMGRAHRDVLKRPSKKHECKMCMLEADTRTQLLKHMKEKHDIDLMPSASCHICGKTVNAKYLERHIAIVHEKVKKFSCNFCNMKFPNREYVKNHIYFEHANKKWKCEKCQLEFEKYHQLRQHRYYVHTTKLHPCSECGKTYKRKSDLTVHFKRCHQVREPHVCSICSKTFLERQKLRVHLMEKHGMSWESTLSKHYARHQRENNCLRRHRRKGVSFVECKVECESDDAYDEDRMALPEEHYQHSVQNDFPEKSNSQHVIQYKGSPLKEDSFGKVSSEQDYSVVEITENPESMADMSEISYIILEESHN